MSTIGDSLPPIDQALLPAAVRNGTKQQKEQYDAALQFERSLVNQMTESMMKTTTVGSDDDDTDSAATKIMKESIPGHMADAIMGAGGIGLAQQLYTAWGDDATKKTSLSDQPAAAGSATTPSTTPAAGQGGLAA